jgi:hypothetical protein
MVCKQIHQYSKRNINWIYYPDINVLTMRYSQISFFLLIACLRSCEYNYYAYRRQWWTQVLYLELNLLSDHGTLLATYYNKSRSIKWAEHVAS